MTVQGETENKAAEQVNAIVEQWHGMLARGQAPPITLPIRMLQNIKCSENCRVGDKRQTFAIPDLCLDSVRFSSGGMYVSELPSPREHLPTCLKTMEVI